jgi:hypothetical protein
VKLFLDRALSKNVIFAATDLSCPQTRIPWFYPRKRRYDVHKHSCTPYKFFSRKNVVICVVVLLSINAEKDKKSTENLAGPIFFILCVPATRDTSTRMKLLGTPSPSSAKFYVS